MWKPIGPRDMVDFLIKHIKNPVSLSSALKQAIKLNLVKKIDGIYCVNEVK